MRITTKTHFLSTVKNKFLTKNTKKGSSRDLHQKLKNRKLFLKRFKSRKQPL